MDKLTPKQKAFADNYIENGGNATAAAIITKKEYVRLFVVINAILNRMEREGKNE